MLKEATCLQHDACSLAGGRTLCRHRNNVRAHVISCTPRKEQYYNRTVESTASLRNVLACSDDSLVTNSPVVALSSAFVTVHTESVSSGSASIPRRDRNAAPATAGERLRRWLVEEEEELCQRKRGGVMEIHCIFHCHLLENSIQS